MKFTNYLFNLTISKSNILIVNCGFKSKRIYNNKLFNPAWPICNFSLNI